MEELFAVKDWSGEVFYFDTYPLALYFCSKRDIQAFDIFAPLILENREDVDLAIREETQRTNKCTT